MGSGEDSTKITLYRYQKMVFGALLDTARVFLGGRWRGLPVKPRFARFISGPTGTGKTFIVQELGRVLGLPIYEVCASSWLPVGCSERGARPTWTDIVEFIQRNERGVIFVDELDKLTGNGTWEQYLKVEIFALLDRRLPDQVASRMSASEDENESFERAANLVRHRLSDGMFVVGAGSFQSLREGRSKRVDGFRGEEVDADIPLRQKDMAAEIPREIANRFSAPILELPALRKQDYQDLLDQISRLLSPQIREIVRRIGDRTIMDAVDNQTGCRWIEEVLLEALIAENVSCSPSKVLQDGQYLTLNEKSF